MSTANHVNESILNEEIKELQKKNRIDHMTYLPGMEVPVSYTHLRCVHYWCTDCGCHGTADCTVPYHNEE